MHYPVASAHEAYRAVQVQSGDPKSLLFLVLDAALRNLTQAKKALENANWEQKHVAISRVQEILRHLSLSLNESVAPELVANLRNLYAHLDRILTEANLENDGDKLEYVQEIMSKLAQAWREAANRCQ
jgi:flagellar protein FliS